MIDDMEFTVGYLTPTELKAMVDFDALDRVLTEYIKELEQIPVTKAVPETLNLLRK